MILEIIITLSMIYLYDKGCSTPTNEHLTQKVNCINAHGTSKLLQLNEIYRASLYFTSNKSENRLAAIERCGLMRNRIKMVIKVINYFRYHVTAVLSWA